MGNQYPWKEFTKDVLFFQEYFLFSDLYVEIYLKSC